ncbi:hypothetical protein V6N12_001830 [Hibiscus sabdariffa]|uniref:Uncharacterized protein n=1 Tax=Hibiscus sabdariffa TaxID=183260 RepID=A0ABR2BS57_9ROSI
MYAFLHLDDPIKCFIGKKTLFNCLVLSCPVLTWEHQFGVQMAAVSALRVQYEADLQPNMSIVVKPLRPLLNARPGPATETPPSTFIR